MEKSKICEIVRNELYKLDIAQEFFRVYKGVDVAVERISRIILSCPTIELQEILDNPMEEEDTPPYIKLINKIFRDMVRMELKRVGKPHNSQLELLSEDNMDTKENLSKLTVAINMIRMAHHDICKLYKCDGLTSEEKAPLLAAKHLLAEAVRKASITEDEWIKQWRK